MYARIGSERVFLPYWLPPRKRTERATLPREGPPRVGVPNCTGSVPGSDVSLRHATEKSRQSSAAAAYLIASANVARNHVRSSGDRSETRRSPSLRREHNRSLSRQRPELSASGSTQHGDWRSTSLGVRVSVSVDSSDLPSGCQRAECGNRELVPHVRVIHARYRYRWRQHRSQEMSVRALRRVVHQDGLTRLKTLYAVSSRQA